MKTLSDFRRECSDDVPTPFKKGDVVRLKTEPEFQAAFKREVLDRHGGYDFIDDQTFLVTDMWLDDIVWRVKLAGLQKGRTPDWFAGAFELAKQCTCGGTGLVTNFTSCEPCVCGQKPKEVKWP
jgi:hypothetical protein